MMKAAPMQPIHESIFCRDRDGFLGARQRDIRFTPKMPKPPLDDGQYETKAEGMVGFTRVPECLFNRP